VIKDRRTDCNSVLLDNNAESLDERFNIFSSEYFNDTWNGVYQTSPNSIHWSRPLVERLICGYFSLIFYNPYRRRWVYESRIHEYGEASAGVAFIWKTQIC
jgi:hypothetical protein